MTVKNPSPCILSHDGGCHIGLSRLCTAEGCAAREMSGNCNTLAIFPQSCAPAVGLQMPHFCTKPPPSPKEVSLKNLYKNDITSAVVLVVLCVCPLVPGPMTLALSQDWYPQIIPKHQASLKPTRITRLGVAQRKNYITYHTISTSCSVFPSWSPLLSKIPKSLHTILLVM